MVRDPLSLSRQYVSAVLRSAIHGLSQIRHPLCLSSRDPRPDHHLDILRLSLPPSHIHIGAARNPRVFPSHPSYSSFLGHYSATKYHTPILDQSFFPYRLPLPCFILEAQPSHPSSVRILCPRRQQLSTLSNFLLILLYPCHHERPHFRRSNRRPVPAPAEEIGRAHV